MLRGLLKTGNALLEVVSYIPKRKIQTLELAKTAAPIYWPIHNLELEKVIEKTSFRSARQIHEKFHIQLPMVVYLQVGRTELPSDIFGVEVRKDILHRVVRWQRARKQQVLH